MLSEQGHAWSDRRGHGDLRKEILRLEAEIDELTGVIERSRKLGLIANIAIVSGTMWLLASTVGAISFDPVALIGAIAAVIGGIVVFGSNTSTSKQAAARIKAAEARRAELIGMIDLRPVGEASDWIPDLRSPDPQ
jgi:hypothetical protein